MLNLNQQREMAQNVVPLSAKACQVHCNSHSLATLQTCARCWTRASASSWPLASGITLSNLSGITVQMLTMLCRESSEAPLRR